MSDQAPAAPDTPPNHPVSDTPDVPWQKRYEDLRPEYDRTTQALREEQSVWEDEQALLGRLAERFPHLLVDDEDETPQEPEYQLTDEPVRDPRYDEIAPTVQQLAAWQAEQQYAADLREVVGDRPLSEFAKRTIKNLTTAGGNDRQALEQAVKDWFEHEDALKPRPAAPAPPQPGKAAELDRNATKDPEERKRLRRERMAAQIEADAAAAQQ